MLFRSEHDPLLDRANRLLDSSAADLAVLADLVQRLQVARRAGDTAKAEKLSDELLDLLYELEGEEEA